MKTNIATDLTTTILMACYCIKTTIPFIMNGIGKKCSELIDVEVYSLTWEQSAESMIIKKVEINISQKYQFRRQLALIEPRIGCRR